MGRGYDGGARGGNGGGERGEGWGREVREEGKEGEAACAVFPHGLAAGGISTSAGATAAAATASAAAAAAAAVPRGVGEDRASPARDGRREGTLPPFTLRVAPGIVFVSGFARLYVFGIRSVSARSAVFRLLRNRSLRFSCRWTLPSRFSLPPVWVIFRQCWISSWWLGFLSVILEHHVVLSLKLPKHMWSIRCRFVFFSWTFSRFFFLLFLYDQQVRWWLGGLCSSIGDSFHSVSPLLDRYFHYFYGVWLASSKSSAFSTRLLFQPSASLIQIFV